MLRISNQGRYTVLMSAHQQNRNPISIHQSTNFAWTVFKRHYGLFIAGLLVIFAAWVVLETIVVTGQAFGITLWALAHVAFLVFFAGMEVGLIKISLALYDGQEPALPDLFAHLALGPKFLAGQCVYLLMVVLGLVLLLIPGFYLGVRYAWAGIFLADGKTNLADSFKHSAAISTAQILRLLAIFVFLLMLNILGASLLGLGLLVTIPFSLLILVSIYRQLGTR